MISPDQTAGFRASLRGASFVPGEAGYDAARVVFNRIIDRRPAIIARCAGAADVITCVKFARDHRLPLSVRAGGHSIAGKAICDDGLMIDLSAMKGIRVDTAARTVRAEPGLTIGEFDRETQAFGLATTMGVISTTGNRYWGRYGAAGLLLRAPAPDGTTAVLLQRRAIWSHQGGTWGLPGGARDSHETVEQAAIREAREETGVRPEQIAIAASVLTAAPFGTHWTYTTVIADATELLAVVGCAESAELRWVAQHQVGDLPLRPGLAASWQKLCAMPELTVTK